MNLVELAVSKCHLTYSFENPGMEKGMCAGLRTLNGEGEPCEECKECGLYYGYSEEHDIKQTNADQIRNMTDDELADFLMDVTMGSLLTKKIMNVRKWLQSEVEIVENQK